MKADPPQRESALEEVLQRRMPARRRALQGLIVLIVVVAVVSLIDRSLPPSVQQAQEAAPIVNPAPPGPVLVLSNVSYGSVRINGRLLSGPPPLVTSFHQGLNTITLTAPPFSTGTCRIRWPEAQVQGFDLCDVRRDVIVPSHVGGRSVIPVAIVRLWLGGDNLPADVRDRALANIGAAVHGVPLSTSVPVGDYIATGQDAAGHINSLQTEVPLRADLVVTPGAPGAGTDVFCEDGGCAPIPKGGVRGWVAGAGVSVQWQFTPVSGGSGGQPLQSRAPDQVDGLRLVLVADAAGDWTVDQQSTTALNGFSLAIGLPSTDCAAGVSYLATRAPSNLLSVSIFADAGLAGCELQLTDAGRASRGTYVWRFGVLLAADAEAHAVLPDLPAAPADEVAAVAV